MKKKFLKITGLTILSVFILVSCEKWIDPDINIDPDAPAQVPLNLWLPSIEQALGYNMVGNDLVRTTNIWMQQFDGVDRQSYTEARYQLTPADVNNVWNSIYANILMNAKGLINQAENTEGKYAPYYAGIGRVITAATLGISTDLFGDMPFREALKGDRNILKPKYDTQEKIYDTIMVILDKAIADLSKSASENLVAVKGDVIYAGNAAKWKKAAYSIKARHLLQLSAVKGNSAYTDALAAAANGFSSSGDDLQVPWETANHNPIFQFMEQRGDIRMGATLVDLMKSIEDPRLPFYAEKDDGGEYTGSLPGSQNAAASKPGGYIADDTAPSVVMSYAELKFIEAEAYFKTNKLNESKSAFAEGVKASVTKVTGAFDQAWYDAKLGSQTLTMELILSQKYINSFGTTRAYADFRRVGIHTFSLPAGAVIPNMPARYPYAQDEIDYNGDNVPSVTLSDKLWWDK